MEDQGLGTKGGKKIGLLSNFDYADVIAHGHGGACTPNFDNLLDDSQLLEGRESEHCIPDQIPVLRTQNSSSFSCQLFDNSEGNEYNLIIPDSLEGNDNTGMPIEGTCVGGSADSVPQKGIFEFRLELPETQFSPSPQRRLFSRKARRRPSPGRNSYQTEEERGQEYCGHDFGGAPRNSARKRPWESPVLYQTCSSTCAPEMGYSTVSDKSQQGEVNIC
jgi:hypothetical protein